MSRRPAYAPALFLGTMIALAAARTAVAQDFEVHANPLALSVAAGGSGSIAVSVVWIAPFTSQVTVVMPSIPNVTFTPSAFVITAQNTPSPVLVSVAPGASPGTVPVTITGTYVSLPSRTATVSLTILPPVVPPDFTLAVSPPSFVTTPGQSVQLTVSATGLNGFTGAVNVVAPTTLPNFTFSPATFSVNAGSSQVVTMTAAVTAPQGFQSGNFTGTASGVTGPRFGPISVTIQAPADFTLTASPPALTVVPGQQGTVVVSATGLGGFSGAVAVTTPSLPGVTFSPSTFTVSPGGAQNVTVAVAPGTPSGNLSGAFVGTALSIGTRTTPFSVVVAGAAADFALAATPSSLAVSAGGPSATLSLLATALNGFAGSVTVTVPSVAGLTLSPAVLTLVPGAPQTVTVTATASASSATVVATFSGTAAGVTGARSVAVTIAITAAPAADFTLAVAPPSISIAAGESRPVTVSAQGLNGFTGAILVTAPAAPGLTFLPASFTLAAGATRVVTVTASPSALPSASSRVFTATSGGLTRTATLLVAITAAGNRPEITSVTPPAVVTPSRGTVLRLGGRGFAPGAVVTSASPDFVVESTSVISATLADVTVSVLTGARVGPVRIDLRNPDGATTLTGGTVLVYPRESLGAPLSVTTAAIVFPVDGTMVATNEAVRPHGLLATTGTGTITGTWRFDGVAFDSWVVTASGGFPVEVTAHVPIPPSSWGSHTLELVVATPATVVSPSVTIISAVESGSRLLAYAPLDRTVIGKEIPEFRWALVPGASGYAVEIGRRKARPIGFRMARPEWRPSRKELATIGVGVFSWRVRAIFPGEVRGDPTPWRTFAILPEAMKLSLFETRSKDGARGLSWSGGATGLVYRVEYFREGESLPRLAALTVAPDFMPKAGLTGGKVVARVTAYEPGGVFRAATGLAPVSAPGPGSALVLVRSEPNVQVVERVPTDGTTVATTGPTVSARWEGAIDAGRVELAIDDVDVTSISRIEPTSITCEALIPLEPGPHTVRLTVGATVETWTFTVEPGASVPAVPTGQAFEAVAQTMEPPSDVLLTAIGSYAIVEEEKKTKPTVQAQVTGQGDVTTGVVSTKFAGDIAYQGTSDPDRFVQQSRNAALRLGVQKNGWGVEGAVGQTTASFTDGAELLTVGFSRLSAAGRLTTPAGSISYYQRIQDTGIAGIASADPQDLEVRGAAFETPLGKTFLVRAIGLEVEQPTGDLFNPVPTKLRTFGVFGKVDVSPLLSLVVEVAHGKVSPLDGPIGTPDAGTAGAAAEDRSGNAFKVGLTGVAGTFSYSLMLRDVEANFVNPANRGLTPGGVADRVGGDLTLGKSFGASSLNLSLRHQASGRSSESTAPASEQTGGMLSYMAPIGTKVSVNLSGNLTQDDADSDESLFLPATDRRLAGGTATLSENLGQIFLSQTASFQRSTDAINPLSDSDTSMLSVSLGGSPLTNVTLSAVVSGTRTAGGTTVGTTDQATVSLQPSLAIPKLRLALQPGWTYMTMKNDTSLLDMTAQTYQASIQFSPAWWRNLLALQLAATWNRTETDGLVETFTLTRRYAATIALRWGALESPSTANMTPGALPGMVPGGMPLAAPAGPQPR